MNYANQYYLSWKTLNRCDFSDHNVSFPPESEVHPSTTSQMDEPMPEQERQHEAAAPAQSRNRREKVCILIACFSFF